MKKIIAFSILISFLCTVFPGTSEFASAAVSPVAISILPPIQFPPDDFTVTGLRASVLWGHHRNFYGLDLGVLGNITDQTFVGAAFSGLANYTTGATDAVGFQIAGLANINQGQTSVYGLQLALGVNYNAAASSVSGLQAALLANIAPFTDIYGVQVGLYNRAKDVYGFQFGLVNVADTLHGIQIGLVNFHRKGTFVVSPILNAGF
jgi:hypothetical protein